MPEEVDVELLGRVLRASLVGAPFVLVFRQPNGRDSMISNQRELGSVASVLRQAADYIEAGEVTRLHS